MPAMVAYSRRSWPMGQATALEVIEPRSATSSGSCSMNIPRGQSGSGHRQVRWRHRRSTGTAPGTSCSQRSRRPRLGATTPQSGQPTSCQDVDTVPVIRSMPRSTASTWTLSRPNNASQREQASVVAGGLTHPVALVNVEVLWVDQHAWSLLIFGDLDACPINSPGEPHSPPNDRRARKPPGGQSGWAPSRE